MFHRIDIRITGPICKCHEQSLSWGILREKEKHSLKLWCNTCGLSIVIPPDLFKARFTLDVPYPANAKTDGKPPPKKKGPNVQKDGNVIRPEKWNKE